ncbi:MAG: amino acid ABC transporter ATP-binding protein [Lactobacillus kefiranofaciens]
MRKMTEEILKVEHLNKFYGDWQALHDINFDLKKGEVLAILGPSGSGKSTLLRTLNGLEDYKDGEIIFHGKKTQSSAKQWQAIRQKIGMVFQSYDLFPNLTVMDNILLAPTKVQKRDRAEVKQIATKLLKRVNMAQYSDSYPRELSGGQQQRVAIVRAWAMKPEILLLDEITASLDPEMVRGIEEIVAELSKTDHMTMILVTHQMNFAKRVADEVLFLEKGKVIEDTPCEQFFTNPQSDRAKQFLADMDF